MDIVKIQSRDSSIRGRRELHYSAGDPGLVQIQLFAQSEQQHELIVSFQLKERVRMTGRNIGQQNYKRNCMCHNGIQSLSK